MRLDEGKQLDPCVPIPYCSLWLHWNSRCLVQIFGSCFPNRESHICRDSRYVESATSADVFMIRCCHVMKIEVIIIILRMDGWMDGWIALKQHIFFIVW